MIQGHLFCLMKKAFLQAWNKKNEDWLRSVRSSSQHQNGCKYYSRCCEIRHLFLPKQLFLLQPSKKGSTALIESNTKVTRSLHCYYLAFHEQGAHSFTLKIRHSTSGKPDTVSGLHMSVVLLCIALNLYVWLHQRDLSTSMFMSTN